MNSAFWKNARKTGRPGFHSGRGELRDKLKRELPQQAAQYGDKLRDDREKKASEDRISGGLADDRSDSEFSKKDIAAGKKVEREHTSDPSIAKEIAKDHLTEDRNYYDKLKKIEKK